MAVTSKEFEILLPLATAWVEEQEQLALRNGVSLNAAQIKDARAVGVTDVNRVRLLKVPQIPLPQHPTLAAVCDATKALGPGTWALSARHGILVRTDRWAQREVIVHELVHTAQYEHLGGVEPFLRHYLEECLTLGYPHGPMEQEAIRVAAKVCAAGQKQK